VALTIRQGVAGDVWHGAAAGPHSQTGDDRQVIGGDPGQTAPVDVELLALQLDVPVDPIQTEQREQRRVRTAHPSHRRGELAAEPARHGPSVPLVEVADQQARSLAVGGLQEAVEQRELGTPFVEGQAEVAVEDVHGGVIEVEVHAQAAARLAPVARQIAAYRAQHGQPREDGVAVGAAAEAPRLPHHDLHAQRRAQVDRLVGVGHPVLAHDLLQADHVGVHLGDHGRDAVEVTLAIEPDPAVDVVACDDEWGHAATS
jgi:hypothetical protein